MSVSIQYLCVSVWVGLVSFVWLPVFTGLPGFFFAGFVVNENAQNFQRSLDLLDLSCAMWIILMWIDL